MNATLNSILGVKRDKMSSFGVGLSAIWLISIKFDFTMVFTMIKKMRFLREIDP